MNKAFLHILLQVGEEKYLEAKTSVENIDQKFFGENIPISISLLIGKSSSMLVFGFCVDDSSNLKVIDCFNLRIF